MNGQPASLEKCRGAEVRFAEHAAGLRWHDIPVPARRATIRLLTDTAGVMVAGLRSPECRALMAQYRRWGGAPESSVPGCPERLPAPSAAFLGGTLAHWYEWDDNYDPAEMHVGAVVVPALMAAAEAGGQTRGADAGSEFLSAVVGAFDVACCIGRILAPQQHQGWLPTGIGSAVGAAAGAARLLGLEPHGVHMAMGLAAVQAGISRQPLIERVNAKNVSCGVAAGRAVECAFMAQAGVEGPRQFLTGTFGLATLFGRDGGSVADGLVQLGHHYDVVDVGIKPYPCCRSTHPVIDAILDLTAADSSLGRRVEAVGVTVPRNMYALVGSPFRPGGDARVAAQFSIPYTAAVALLQGQVTLADFEPRTILANRAVLDLAARVVVVPDDRPVPPDVWWQGTSIELRGTDGAACRRVVDVIKGSPARPLTDEEMTAKLEDAAGGSLTSTGVRALADAAHSVDNAGIEPLTAALRDIRVPGSGHPR